MIQPSQTQTSFDSASPRQLCSHVATPTRQSNLSFFWGSGESPFLGQIPYIITKNQLPNKVHFLPIPKLTPQLRKQLTLAPFTVSSHRPSTWGEKKPVAKHYNAIERYRFFLLLIGLQCVGQVPFVGHFCLTFKAPACARCLAKLFAGPLRLQQPWFRSWPRNQKWAPV